MSRTITGLFDSRLEADAAVQHLLSHDSIERSHIKVYAADGATPSGTAGEDRGFWASLKDLFVPEEDRSAYSEGLRRGGVLLSVDVPDELVEHASDVLEANGAVDLDSREAEWRSEGWSATGTGATPAASTGLGATAATGGATTATTAMGGSATASMGGSAATSETGLGGTSAVPVNDAPVAATADTALPAAGLARGGDEEVIPLVEEQLRVGKRDVEHGRVRVRSYTVETPVSEQVTLRQEHVDVQRRAVDRPLTDAEHLFQDRTIEATEHAEEAVIAKEARVKEELVIRKVATEDIQTVSDTVRHTEVKVEDERDNLGTVPAATPDTTLPRR
ncbi:YsnF/AvaK domain-containing protein [Roseomonas elaeocarpi]|uniref:YsnF/AvaK domain-containing protein n=1 Tax=Roseomonas elaeocarpi TaxID=907779 RepID=A0ABV6JU75_9PROT